MDFVREQLLLSYKWGVPQFIGIVCGCSLYISKTMEQNEKKDSEYKGCRKEFL